MNNCDWTLGMSSSFPILSDLNYPSYKGKVSLMSPLKCVASSEFTARGYWLMIFIATLCSNFLSRCYCIHTCMTGQLLHVVMCSGSVPLARAGSNSTLRTVASSIPRFTVSPWQRRAAKDYQDELLRCVWVCGCGGVWVWRGRSKVSSIPLLKRFVSLC